MPLINAVWCRWQKAKGNHVIRVRLWDQSEVVLPLSFNEPPGIPLMKRTRRITRHAAWLCPYMRRQHWGRYVLMIGRTVVGICSVWQCVVYIKCWPDCLQSPVVARPSFYGFVIKKMIVDFIPKWIIFQ